MDGVSRIILNTKTLAGREHLWIEGSRFRGLLNQGIPSLRGCSLPGLCRAKEHPQSQEDNTDNQ